MTDLETRALLPEGLRDFLPPDAEFEADVVARLIGVFTSHGYDPVKPPLIEFEESLLGGPGAAQAPTMFRLMDPVSQRMLAIRSDMTIQVARIATTRLAHQPRPLRLCYQGQVLRVKGSQLRAARQFAQAGAELIGGDPEAADVEVILVAAEALTRIGIPQPTLDLTLPTLVPAIAQGLGLNPEATRTAREALDGKDVARLDSLPAGPRDLFAALLATAGPADEALPELRALDLPAEARALADGLAARIARVRAAMPEIQLTVDPGEFRAHEYHVGFGFTAFARGVRGELGRGGRYLIEPAGGGPVEEATGFSLYVDSIIRALPQRRRRDMLFLPAGTPADLAARLRAEGWRTRAGLAVVEDARAEARRLDCTHWLDGGTPRPVG
jgi:ATP phosphoribosyltransferase regulatory subunit